MAYKVVHYINQFYAGIGGEEFATTEPAKVEGVKGPGMALNAALKAAGLDEYMAAKQKALDEWAKSAGVQ